MNRTLEHQFSIGEIDDGRWAAISDTTPFFYFVAKTQEEVAAIANRALDFFYGCDGKLVSRKVTKKEVRNFEPRKLEKAV